MRTSPILDQFGRKQRRPRLFGFGRTPESETQYGDGGSGPDAISYLLHDIDDQDTEPEIDRKKCPTRTSGNA